MCIRCEIGMSQTEDRYNDWQKAQEAEKNERVYRAKLKSDQCCNNCSVVGSVVIIKGKVI